MLLSSYIEEQRNPHFYKDVLKLLRIFTNHLLMLKSSFMCRHTFKQLCVDGPLILSLNFLIKIISLTSNI